MNEILRIVLNRNKERKLLTNDDVKNICNIVISKSIYNIPLFINFLPVCPNDPQCGGECIDDVIFFFKHGVEEMADIGYRNLIKNVQMDGSKIDIYNYYYLFIIFHELAHVRQKYMIKYYPRKFESKIFNICTPYIQNDDFYSENHDIFPTEVNANNLAGTRVLSLYSQMPKEFVSKNDVNAYQLLTIQNMVHEIYELEPRSEEIISPAELFVKAVCDNIDLSDNEFYELVEKKNGFYDLISRPNNFSLYRKLMLGLPISFDEYSRVDLLYKVVEDGEEINLIKKLQKKPNSTHS